MQFKAWTRWPEFSRGDAARADNGSLERASTKLAVDIDVELLR